VLDIHVRIGDHDRVIVSRPTHGAPEPVEGDAMTIGWAKSAGLVYSGT